MILISHRGNIDGRLPNLENSPDYIDAAIEMGFDVEIDVRLINGNLWLGHDTHEYKITTDWLINRSDYLWIHCKDMVTLNYFTEYAESYHYFYHANDDATITSGGFNWVHPNIQPIDNGIAVLPEIHNWDVSNCLGVCSDEILKYSK